MSVVIKIDKKIYNAAKEAASINSCSISSQLEYWVKVGKCAIDNPDLPVELISDIIIMKKISNSLAEKFSFETRKRMRTKPSIKSLNLNN